MNEKEERREEATKKGGEVERKRGREKERK